MTEASPTERLRRWFGAPIPADADLAWLGEAGVRSLGDLARLMDAELSELARWAGRAPAEVLERARRVLLEARVPRPLVPWDEADVFGAGGVLSREQQRSRAQIAELLAVADPATVRQACELLVALADPALVFATIDLDLSEVCAERPSVPMVGAAPGLADVAATGMALALAWTGYHHLDRLDLRSFLYGSTCVSMVVDSPESRALTSLDVGRCGLRDDDAIALASSPHLRGLRRLVACENPLGPAGVAALAGMPSLELLDLRHVAVGAEGVGALARSRAHVFLHVDDVGEQGAVLLTRSSTLPEGCRLAWAARLAVHRGSRETSA